MSHARGVVSHFVVPATLLAILLTAHAAAAFDFGPMGDFIQTRNGQTQWKTNASVVTNSLVVKTNSVVIGSTEMDIAPDTGAKVLVTIEQWSEDARKFTITMLAAPSTAFNFTYSNPGYNLTVYEAGIATHTCTATVSPCHWPFPNASIFHFSILTPSGVQQNSNGDQPPPNPGGGSSDAAGGAAAVPGSDVPALPNPIKTFPSLPAPKWIAILAGIVLTLNGIPKTRALLPPFAQLPGNTSMFLFIGVVTITLVWLTSGS